MLQRVAVCCSVLQYVALCCSISQCVAVCCSMLQCVAVCCSMLQYVTVCCSVLQCVAVSYLVHLVSIDSRIEPSPPHFCRETYARSELQKISKNKCQIRPTCTCQNRPKYPKRVPNICSKGPTYMSKEIPIYEKRLKYMTPMTFGARLMLEVSCQRDA